MDSTLIASIIGAIATILVAILPPIVNRTRREKGALSGTIEQLIIPLGESRARETIKELLPKAKVVKICGWSLFRLIDENRHILRELLQRGCDVRILMLDPNSTTVADLDNQITTTDPVERRSRNWTPVISKNITQKDILRTIDILKENGILGVLPSKTLHLCNSLLPYGIVMIEKTDGTGWVSTQIYPLHPDFRTAKRFMFTLGSNKSKLWESIQEHFDAAWDDPGFSYPYIAEQENV